MNTQRLLYTCVFIGFLPGQQADEPKNDCPVSLRSVEACSPTVLACRQGVDFRLHCPPTFVFDATRQICSRPGRVPECKIDEGDHRVKSLDLLCENMTDGVYKPQASLCSSTVLTCTRGLTDVSFCPEGLVFDELRRICNFRKDVSGCEETRLDTPSPPLLTSTGMPITNIRWPESVIRRVFDPELDYTALPESAVEVAQTTMLTPQAATTQSPAPDFEKIVKPVEPVRRALPSEPGPFVPPAVPPAVPVTFPPPLPPPAATTTASFLHEPEPQSLAEVPEAEYCEGRLDGFYALRHCSRFFINCTAPASLIAECPEALIFDEERQVCDPRSNVAGCMLYILPPATAAPGSDPEAVRRCERLAQGLYEYEPCSIFYLSCSPTFSTILSCSMGLFFDSFRRVCDYPNNIPNCLYAFKSGYPDRRLGE